MKHRLFLLLGLSPLLAHAQAPTAPRFYVGAALYTSYYQSPGPGVGVPVQVTLGYQLRPRLAVQLSATYSAYRSGYATAGALVDANGTAYPYTQEVRNASRALALALLGRYSLTRRPAQRVQAWALGGFIHERGTYTSASTTIYAGSSSTNEPVFEENSLRTRNLLLGIGPGVSCRLVGPLDAQLELVLGSYLHSTLPTPPGVVGAASLGLRYRFGN